MQRLRAEFATSERHACELMSIPRSSSRYRSRRDDSELREQLIERTAAHQALDLLDAAIMAVANAHRMTAAEEIDCLREVEQRIHEKVHARKALRPVEAA